MGMMGMGSSGGSFGAARSWGGNGGACTGSKDPNDLEEFIRYNNIDDRAADALRSVSADVQEAVIARGDLRETRNPSSALIGRLRDAQSSAIGSTRFATGGGTNRFGPYWSRWTAQHVQG